MRTNKGIELRELCGEYVLIGTGVENIDFSKIISLNETAAWLWREVKDKEFTAESMADMLIERYEVDEATALADTTELTKKWLSEGVITV